MVQKICFVNPTILLKRPIAEIIERIKGYEVTLLIPRKLGKKRDTSLHYSDLPGVNIITYPTVQMPFMESEFPIPAPSFFFKAFKIFKENDIVHMWVYFYISSLWLSFIKLFFPRKKFILTMDTVPGESFSAGKLMDSLFKIYHKLCGWLVFGAPNLITLYGKSLLPFAKNAGINLEKVKITPTGVDVAKYSGSYKCIKDEFGIRKNEQLLLYVGLLNNRKGIDIILKTLSRIKERNFKMIIVGDGPQRKEYEKMALRLGLQNKVIFTGFRKDVKNFYRSADIFFFPSRGEGLAGAIMEAMASGLPIVSSRIPCTIDLVKHGENGFLCTDNYQQQLEYLLDQRTNMGRTSKNLIERFSWARSLKSFMQLYKGAAK
ncbi:glycosyltransferase family 4 protein [Candidatus Woesearchaeota archaeon]|nr:glycosyltransferase family 4 protein [Candidatus Woesearchaeota archaeon]